MPYLRSILQNLVAAIAAPMLLLMLTAPALAVEDGDTNRVVRDSARAAADSVDWSGGIVYGPGFAYYLHADTGWVMDHTLERPFDAMSVFYQRGYEPMGAPVYIISVLWYRDSDVTVPGAIDQYGDLFASQCPDAQVKTCSSLVTARGDSVPVVQYLAYGSSIYERVAFCDAPGVIVGIMIRSRYPGNFFESMPAFANTVRSYLFLSNKVRIDRPKVPPDST